MKKQARKCAEWTFQRSTDYELIRSILTIPKAFYRMRNDLVAPIHQFQVHMPPNMRAVIAYLNGDPKGVFLLDMRGPAVSRVHFCFSPEVWGGGAAKGAQEFIAWMWKATSIDVLDAAVPSYNRLAYRFAWNAGFRQYGIDAHVGRKNGKPFDLILMRLERPDVHS